MFIHSAVYEKSEALCNKGMWKTLVKKLDKLVNIL